MAGVPYIFGNATTSIPLTNLDANFNTGLTIGNTTVGLGNTVTTLGNVTIANATTISAAGNVFLATSSGSVGIGTTTPTTKLHVKSIVNDSTNGLTLEYNSGTAYYGRIFSSGNDLTISADTGNTGGVARFLTGGTERMRIDSSGNVGIGTTSPAANLDVSSSGATIASISTTGVSPGVALKLIGATATYKNWLIGSSYAVTAGALEFIPSTTVGGSTFTTPAMTIDPSGNLLVGTTATIASSRQTVSFTANTANGIDVSDSTNTSGATFCVFSNGASTIGSIGRVSSTAAVSYNTTSDQRLKSNIVDANPVLDKLMNVKVRQFDWTEGDLHQDAGFIAQELAPVLSGIVTEGKTEEDYWQLDYSRLTPYLVKAIQEQQALITTLQEQVTALQAKVGA